MNAKIEQVWKSTILCIKYPFLYPRNRFTDVHYNNSWVAKKLNNLEEDYKFSIPINILTQKELKEYNKKYKRVASTDINFEKGVVNVTYQGPVFWIDVNYKVFYKFNTNEYLGNSGLTYNDVSDIILEYKSSTNISGNLIYKPILLILLKDSVKTKNYFTFKSLCIYTKTSKKYEEKFLRGINSFLRIFHILPSYTELDAMEPGWRQAFGESICKEIRGSLLTTYIRKQNSNSILSKIRGCCKGIKLLYTYRITQIKEKYGELRWYAYGDTEDTLKIISKYEYISEHTCIICGKEARYRTRNWISPYCEKHKPLNDVEEITVECGL